MADGDWDEDAHPRGPDGKFGGGGGSDKKTGGKSDVQTWAAARAKGGPAASTHEDLKTWAKDKASVRDKAAAKKSDADKPKAEAPKVQKREWTDKQMEGKSNETWKDHYVDKDGNKGTPEAHPDKGGKPTAERAAMHEEKFIKPAFEGRKTARELDMKPVAILTMGGPASGKGTILKELDKRGLDKSMFVHVDPDEVKGKLPEYEKSVPNHKEGKGGQKGDGTGATFKGAAAQVHEESSHVAKEIERQAIEKGHNVIIDGTGGNAKAMVERIKGLEAKGYHVEMHHAHLDPEEGIKRAAGRAEGSGRFVPEEVIRGTYGKIEKSMDQIHAASSTLRVYDGQNGHRVAFERKSGAEPKHGRSPREAVEKGRAAKFKLR
jgi:predicted ABC-type ATPase